MRRLDEPDAPSAHGHHDHDTGSPLVPFEEARQLALDGIPALLPRELPLHGALGCVLADDVRAPHDLPPFTSSAMDGFAIRARDVKGATADHAVPLRLAGRVEIGRTPAVAVGGGEAAAVPTGGVLPDGADAVVPIERCVVRGDRVLVLQATEPGRFVRPAGQDVRAGEVLVRSGQALGAPELGLLASAGLSSVRVHPRARVAIVSTGDELVDPDRRLAPGQIHDANAATLRAAVEEAGAVATRVDRVGDDPAAFERLAREAAEGADVVVSSGGVSVGERDPVKRAFGTTGDVRFVDVAMQPGKPQAFGRIGHVPFFGLPGNPVSVFVSFEAFVRPALMRLMGRPEGRPEVVATLEEEISGPPNKLMFARVQVRRDGDRWIARSTGERQSNLLATVSRANGLALVPVGVGTVRAGEQLRVLLFRGPEGA